MFRITESISNGLLLLLVAPCLAGRTREPPPPSPVSRQTPVERWLHVKLNQFMASDTRTFPMRFYYNDEFPGPNIVINVGGEWKVSAGWTTGGLPYEIAKRLKAGLFYTEHRYYGQTRPFGNTKLSNLRFLTVEQALADLAQFITYIKSDAFERGRYKSGKVVMVGCSYGGTIVTFMRLAYPHLVDAAFADSGPVHAQEDFPEYMEVVAAAIREQGGEECLSSIKEAMKQLVELMATEEGPEQISVMFKTCTTIQADSALDVTTFYGSFPESFSDLVQNANPGDIPNACAVLTNDKIFGTRYGKSHSIVFIAAPVERLANWITSQEWSQPCIEIRYTELLSDFRDTSYDSEDYDMRLWTYQSCVEFGWHQTTTSSNQPFLSTVPLEYFHQLCKDIFSVEFNEQRLRQGIKRTNIMFGGLRYRPDNVISVTGALDPWSPLAPNATHGRHNSPVYVVPGESHCRAIQANSADDSAELKAARKAVLKFMSENVGSPKRLASAMSDATNIGATLVFPVSALVALF